MYLVVGRTNSRTLRVLWTLQEIGVPYKQIAADPGSDIARRYSDSGKIPVLFDQGTKLMDSVAIMTYLADKHGQLTAKAGTLARARQDALTLWIIEEMDTVLRLASGKMWTPEVSAQAHVLEREATARFAEASEALIGVFSGPFLMGAKITLPDILACHCLNWAIAERYYRPNAKLLRYTQTLRQRPAYRAAISD